MGPKKTFVGIVRIAFGVGVGMMKAVRGDPLNRSVLTGQTTHEGQKILQGFGNFEAAVSEQAVIAQSDSNAARDPMKGQA